MKQMEDTVKVHRLTKRNIPKKEVIAIGYQNECLVGWIHEENGEFACDSNNEILEQVTHFINIPKVK